MTPDPGGDMQTCYLPDFIRRPAVRGSPGGGLPAIRPVTLTPNGESHRLGRDPTTKPATNTSATGYSYHDQRNRRANRPARPRTLDRFRRSGGPAAAIACIFHLVAGDPSPV